MTSFFIGLREAWGLAKPYFWSEERWAARGLLAAIIALNLLMVGMNLILNFWNNDFYNAIQNMDSHTAIQLLILYSKTPGTFFPMPGFVEIVTVYIVIAVYAFYLNQMLQIRWRQWITRDFINNWLADRRNR
jgi:putative ATP-binding cassette transporter